MDYETAKRTWRYNKDTGYLYWMCSRQHVHIGMRAGCERTSGYRYVNYARKAYAEHRIIFLLMTGKWPTYQIDHINHVHNDNRWINLREVSHHENHRNRAKCKRNRSGFTGVSWDTSKQKWRASIRVDYQEKNLGTFKNKADAIQARLEGNEKYGFHRNHGLV